MPTKLIRSTGMRCLVLDTHVQKQGRRKGIPLVITRAETLLDASAGQHPKQRKIITARHFVLSQ